MGVQTTLGRNHNVKVDNQNSRRIKVVIQDQKLNLTHLTVNAHDDSITLVRVNPEFLDFGLDAIYMTLRAVFRNVAWIQL